ncbi:MAG: hypothetical protein ACAI25_17960, partial [Planctomycetota bacterium]
MRGLKIDFEGSTPGAPSPAPEPANAPAQDAVPTPAPLPPPAPIAALPLARALENAIASVVTGPSKLVLALSDDGSELDASFAAALDTTRRRAVHVRLAPGLEIGARAHGGLVDALRERTSGRPGVAAILDPLIRSAASFVLGKDLWSLESFLTP